MAERIQNIQTAKRTRLAEAVRAQLLVERRSVTTPYVVFHLLRKIFAQKDNHKLLYLRSPTVSLDHLRRVIRNLSQTRAIDQDPDYNRGVYQVVGTGEVAAEEICALVNPFGYISHLSAMQRWSISTRRPEALHITMPSVSAARPLIQARMAADYGVPFADLPSNETVRLHFIQPPELVRGRKVSVFHAKHPGQWLQIEGEYARLATIGQTFLDMLENPQRCGGMPHVLDVWREHARTFADDIIYTVNEIGTPIAKVRAGYMLENIICIINDHRIEQWTRFAQRGGSRILDPTKAFSPVYSEKWMLSLNV